MEDEKENFYLEQYPIHGIRWEWMRELKWKVVPLMIKLLVFVVKPLLN